MDGMGKYDDVDSDSESGRVGTSPQLSKRHYAKRIRWNMESFSKTIPCFFQVMDRTCLLLGSDYSFPNRLGFAYPQQGPAKFTKLGACLWLKLVANVPVKGNRINVGDI